MLIFFFFLHSFYSFRGRGGYFNRNMNNMGGGGYRGGSGGYRGGGNFRGRNFNRNYSNQSSGTGIPQQPSKSDQQQQPSASSTGVNSGADAAVPLPQPVTAGKI